MQQETRIQIPSAFKELNNPQYRYKLYYGGRGGAKSESIARILLHKAQEKPSRILCTREFQNSIKESVHHLIKKIIEEYKIPYFKITKDSIYSIEYDSEFIFKGLHDNIFSIKSMDDINICWVEEAQTISKQSIDILLPTIRAKDSEIWFSFNRLMSNDPIWVALCENPDEFTYVRKVNWSDNPFFPKVLNQERLRVMKNKPTDYAHIWEGEPTEDFKGTVVKYFNEENKIKVNYIDTMDLHICCDFNVDPMCWVLAHKTSSKIYFFDELVIENTTTRESIRELIRRYPDHKGKIIINGDASGNYRSTQSEHSNYAIIKNELCFHRCTQAGCKYTIDQKLECYNKNTYHVCEKNPLPVIIDIRDHNPQIQNRVHAFNERIYTNDAKRCVFIDSKCEKLLYNITHLKYKEGTTIIDLPTHNQIRENTELKFIGHPFDAASYPVELYWPIKKEV